MKKYKLHIPEIDTWLKGGSTPDEILKKIPRQEIHYLIETKASKLGLLTGMYIITIEATNKAEYVLFNGDGNFSWSTERQVFEQWEAEEISWQNFINLKDSDVKSKTENYFQLTERDKIAWDILLKIIDIKYPHVKNSDYLIMESSRNNNLKSHVDDAFKYAEEFIKHTRNKPGEN